MHDLPDPAPLGKSRAPRLVLVWCWAQLALIWALFELPGLVHGLLPQLEAPLPALELPALLTAWALATIYGWTRRTRAVLWFLGAVLVAYRIDQVICILLMRAEPMLYDQWFMLRHLFVLIQDLLSLRTLLVLCALIALPSLAVQIARSRFRAALPLFAPEQRRRTALTAALAWALALALSMLPASLRPVQWLSASLARNLQASLAMYHRVQGAAARSPYADFQRLRPARRPDVLLFIVESYGKLLFTHAGSRDRHTRFLQRLETRVRQAGWQVAGAFSTSSVSGGRSWLAEGTMLMGTSIAYESLFQHLVAQPRRPANLVSFLNGAGYQSVLLAPSDRNRPGVRVVNRYGFARVLSYETLHYQGPQLGWGLVPDQFSLAFAAKHLLDQPKAPVFLDFHMVSSHAPWTDVPELLPDERVFAAAPIANEPRKDSPGLNTVLTRLSRYGRQGGLQFAHMGQLVGDMLERYQATIEYDLELIVRYLEKRERDALVIVVGDHQPPVIAPANDSFDSPIFVLSRSPQPLRQILSDGFRPTMALSADQPPSLSHAGLFSLLVRALTADDPPAPGQLPALARQGFAL